MVMVVVICPEGIFLDKQLKDILIPIKINKYFKINDADISYIKKWKYRYMYIIKR